MTLTIIISALVGLVLGSTAIFLIGRSNKNSTIKEAAAIRSQAKESADKLLEDNRNHIQEMRNSLKNEESELRKRFEKMQEQSDERLLKREELLDQKQEKTEKVREEFEDRKRHFQEKEKELQLRIDEQNQELEKIASLKKEEAKELLLERIEKDIAPELKNVFERKVSLMRESAEEEGANILVQCIQKFAPTITNESTVAIVKLESDAIKGKIIGREGRNINAFEAITGVDVIIDDTPGAITISCFDVFRRYIAKMALEELIKDGRIHPSSIEQSVQKAQKRAEQLIFDLGKKAAQDLGVTGFSDQILKLVGRLRFRSSYGQNVLNHSLEVAWLAEAIAYEIPGADPEVCKKAGLVHDIGKAVSHEVEGGHAIIGKEILEKFGVSEPIVTAMKSHHEDFPYESIEARILQAADAISASRPGARRETLEKYIKRLKELENIASGFSGVEKVFAIQAGREVRVFVNAAKVDDLQSEKLSFEIARKIEKDCEYPGEVRVAVYRESKFEDTAA